MGWEGKHGPVGGEGWAGGRSIDVERWVVYEMHCSQQASMGQAIYSLFIIIITVIVATNFLFDSAMLNGGFCSACYKGFESFFTSDLRDAGVDCVTLGQYMQPTKFHLKVCVCVQWVRLSC